MALQVERWDDQQVTGSSSNFGKAKFSPAAFAQIQFNLDKQKTEPEMIEPGDGGGINFIDQ